jgi:hypothetical protein
MSRTEDGQIVATLREIVGLVGLLVSLASLAGFVGGWYIIRYQTQQNTDSIKALQLAYHDHEQASAKRDAMIGVVIVRLDSIDHTLRTHLAVHFN